MGDEIQSIGICAIYGVIVSECFLIKSLSNNKPHTRHIIPKSMGDGKLLLRHNQRHHVQKCSIFLIAKIATLFLQERVKFSCFVAYRLTQIEFSAEKTLNSLRHSGFTSHFPNCTKCTCSKLVLKREKEKYFC